MKKFFQFFQFVVAMLVASSVWAIPPSAERMRFAPDLTDPDVQASEMVVDDLVNHLAVAEWVYQEAKSRNAVPKGAEDQSIYIQHWMRVNKLRPGLSSQEEFNKMVGGGFRFLTEADLPQAAPAPASKLVADVVSADVAKVQALMTQLSAMQQKVEKLEKAGQSADSLKSDLKAFARKVDSVNTGSAEARQAVRELKKGLEQLRSGELTTQMVNDINRKVGGHLNDLVTRVGVVEGQLTKLSEKVDAMEMVSFPIGYGVVAAAFGEGSAKQYADHRGWVYLALVALLVASSVVLAQLPQRRNNRAVGERVDGVSSRLSTVERELHGVDGEGGLSGALAHYKNGQIKNAMEMVGLKGELAEQASRLDEVCGKLESLQGGLIRTNGLVRQQGKQLNEQLNVLVEDVQDIQSLTFSEVQFDSGNPGLEVLEALPVGGEHALFWKGRTSSGHFTVKIWREDSTPAGLVETNIVRNAESGQLAEPIALKRLKKRIEAAVIDGRIPVVKMLAAA